MRKLMWFVIGFAVSCGLFSYGLARHWMLPLAAASAAGMMICLFLCRKRSWFRYPAAVLLGCLMGCGWFAVYQNQHLKPVEILDGQEQILTVTASDYSYETAYGTAVEGFVTHSGRTYQTRVCLEENCDLSPGDQLRGNLRIRLTTPRAQKESRYFQAEGIFLLCYQRGDMSITPTEDMPLRCYPAVLRRELRNILQDTFPADMYPFAKALLLGDTEDLDYHTDTALKVSGIRHIVAISGQHISMLYALVMLVTLRKRFVTAFVGIPMLLLFAAVAGFTPSVTRSCIMLILMLVALLLEREYDPLTALSASILVMLLVNPFVITSASLQFSVGCVAGILLFGKPISAHLKVRLEKTGLPRKIVGILCGSISVSLSAMSLTVPLSAGYFGMISLVSVITNLMTLWAVSILFYGITIVCVIYPIFGAAAKCLAAGFAWVGRYVIWVAKQMASFSLAAVYSESIYITAWLVFLYILLTAYLLMKKKQPAVFVCCAVLSLCMVLTASWAETASTNTRITMVDVGQGQSILLEGEGAAFLVDCGGDDPQTTADEIASVLLSRGISHLDGIILTHYDKDHSNALANLLTRVDTKLLILPDTRNDFLLPQWDGERLYVWEDIQIVAGSVKLEIFGPIYSGHDNENSLCVLFDTENCDILITGDRSDFGERMLMRRRELPDVDILVAGHHGAETSTSPLLLEAVTPEIVLISVAEENVYGHPAPQLLQRLAEYGCTVYRTDEWGTVTIRR